MNLNQLEYFVTAAELLNFTKAAEKCFISQTAMTQQIRALEKNIGVDLFIRDKHHVELTPAGKVYLDEARDIIHRSNEAIRLTRLASEGITGSLTIGFISGYGQSRIADILHDFRKAYPYIKINLVKNNLSVLMGLLEQGSCDLLFTVKPKTRDNKNIDHMYIRSYQIMAVVPKGHPLEKHKTVTYSDLENENFIMMQPKGRAKDQMEESALIYERGGYIPRVVEVEGDQETLLLMVSAGMGISLLPEYITRSCQNDKNLNIIPLINADGKAETVDLEMSWNAGCTNPAVEQFINMLKKELA